MRGAIDTIAQLVGYQKIEALKKRARYDDPLPRWVYEGAEYPHHPEQSRLIDRYREALKKGTWQPKLYRLPL